MTLGKEPNTSKLVVSVRKCNVEINRRKVRVTLRGLSNAWTTLRSSIKAAVKQLWTSLDLDKRRPP